MTTKTPPSPPSIAPETPLCGLRNRPATHKGTNPAATRQHGAETPFVRPAELADDQQGTNAVVIHAIKWFEAQGAKPDATCLIYATAPLLDVERLKEGWDRLQQPGKRFAFSVTSYG